MKMTLIHIGESNANASRKLLSKVRFRLTQEELKHTKLVEYGLRACITNWNLEVEVVNKLLKSQVERVRFKKKKTGVNK